MAGEWDDEQKKFSSTLAASLFPSIVQLVDTSALPQPATEDADGRAGKLEVGRQATQLRAALSTLKIQAQHMPAGDLSVDDQEWLLEQLQKELERKRVELKSLANQVSSAPPPEQETTMQMD